MGEWLRYFLGTPQRFTRTVGCLAVLAVILIPGFLRGVLDRLFQEAMPAMGPLLAVGIVILAMRKILGIGSGKKH